MNFPKDGSNKFAQLHLRLIFIVLCGMLMMLPSSVVHGLDKNAVYPTANLAKQFQILSTDERGVEVIGKTAYLADADRGLRIFDVSDPDNIVQLGQIAIPGKAHEVSVVDNIAYVAAGQGGLKIIDVANPAQPLQKKIYPANAWDVYVTGTMAYVAAWSEQAHVVNVKDSTNPTRIATLPTTDRAVGIQVVGNIAYVVDNRDKGLRIYDVTNPHAPIFLGFGEVAGTHEKVYVNSTMAYLASGVSGIHILNVSQPSAPIRVGGYNTPGYARDIHVVEGIAYIADQEGGIRVLDVTNPAHPTEIGFYDTPGNAQGIAVRNGVIYVADSVDGLYVIPLAAYRPDTLPGDSINVGPPVEPEGLCCIGGYVYLDGKPVANPIVTISDSFGMKQQAQIASTKMFSYYQSSLTGTGLTIKVGDVITLTAQVQDKIHSVQHTVIADIQQVDIVIPNASDFTRPLATIVQYLPARTVNTGQILQLIGRGQDSDLTPEIVKYLWKSDSQGVLGTTPTLAVPVSKFQPGTHQITLTVQDTEGEWSLPTKLAIEVLAATADIPEQPWTLMFYLAGDYTDAKLKRRFEEVIKHLRSKDLPANVQNVAIQFDYNDRNSASGDSYRIYGTRNNDLTVWSEPIHLGEIAMDEPQALRDFVIAAQQQAPHTYYYLAIADHGQAVSGIAWDATSAPNLSAYLKTTEINEALADSRIKKIDILHLDACSMNLLETAYELRQVTDYLISSQYLAWSTFPYTDYLAGLAVNKAPRRFAEYVAQRYAESVHSLGLPYTISVLNLAYAETATLALSLLSDELLTLIEANATWKTVLDSTRLLSQVFTSDTDHMNEVSEDFYVDLVDWLKDLEDNVADPLVFEKIGELRAILTDPEQLIWRSYSMSGTMTEDYNKDRIGFDGVHGVSIYYPIHRNSETYEDYQEDQLFQFTQKSSWPVFLDKQLLALDGGKPLDPTPPPFPLLEIPPTTTDKQLFLPLISR